MEFGKQPFYGIIMRIYWGIGDAGITL